MPQVAMKFCCFCGVNLGSLASMPPADDVTATAAAPPARSRPLGRPGTFQRPQNQRPQLELADDDTDADPYEHMEHLDIDIQGLEIEIAPVRRMQETIGGLMAAGPGGDIPRNQPKLATKKARKEVIAAFMQEGAAIRPKTSTEVK